jgi:Cu/Zn superoxide dismutase
VQCETASGAVRLCAAGSALQGFTVLESTADSVFLRMNDMGDVYASNTNGTEFSLSASAVPCYMHYCDFHQVGRCNTPAGNLQHGLATWQRCNNTQMHRTHWQRCDSTEHCGKGRTAFAQVALPPPPGYAGSAELIGIDRYSV